MKILNIKKISDDIQLIDCGRFDDERGYFMETARFGQLFPDILDADIAQINESFSHKNVVRGLHFQSNPYMGKLVRVISGHIIDIVLDIRKGSPTYGMAHLVQLMDRADFVQWLWVPVGFAHGFIAVTDSKIEYLCTGEWNGKSEYSITPFDPDIDFIGDDIAVDVMQNMINRAIMSDKDHKGMTLKEWFSHPGAEDFLHGDM
jgi:dTDP-4-dehydrorhamnose 3,5-epimerase